MSAIILAILSFVAFWLMVLASPFVILFRLYHWYVYENVSMDYYFQNLLNSITQFGAALLYGTEDWTTSAMTHYEAKYYNNKYAKYFEIVINIFAYLYEKDHCEKTYHRERTELGKSEGEL